MYSNDCHKFIVIIYKKQKSFNVTIINYKNSFAYVQRQINRLLRKFRRFVRVYVNDIVIFSKIIVEHIIHLRKIFNMFRRNNISIKFNKIFLNYLFVQLLNQKIDFFNLLINEKKLKIIAKLSFFRILRQFEIYLKLTN